MSVPCAVCGQAAPLACSGCKTSRYCSPECQLVDWQKHGHKKACKIQQQLNALNAEQEARRPPRPPAGRCTGCNVQFTKTDREYQCAGTCKDCGYKACGICISHDRRGTCYCTTGNFGRPYCKMPPYDYHADGWTGRMYTGDRHPPLLSWEPYTEADFEAEPRKCGTCGEVVRMLKPERAVPRRNSLW